MTEIEPVYKGIPYLELEELNELISIVQEGEHARKVINKPGSAEEQETLAHLIADSDVAFERIVGSNLRRVHKIALRFYGILPWDDLEQAGVWGIYSAVNSFDPKKNVSFATHVTNHIRWAILDAIQSESGLSDDNVTNIRHISDFELLYMQTQGRKPSEEEIADRLSLSISEVRLMQNLRARQWQPSIDDPIAPESETTWGDFIADDSISPEEAAETLEIFQMVIDYLKGRGGVVPEHILMLVQHIWGHMTYEEIGKAHGLTKQRIEQIIKRLYTLLEYPLRDYKPPKRKLR